MVFVFEDPPTNALPCFLVQVMITLVLCRIVGKLLAYVKQPRVVGEIIGGILLGPSALGNIPNFTATIFPQLKNQTLTPNVKLQSLDTFQVVASIGLIFFMFLMGLELEFELVRKVWKQIASIAGPFATGAIFSLWWTKINDGEAPAGWVTPDQTSFILFCGTCLSFTAFPVLCAILKAAKMTLSCAAINDVVAWCILAIASSFSKSGDPTEGGYTVMLSVLFICTVFFVLRPIVHYLYNHFRTKGDVADSQMFSTLMILLLLLCAFTAEVIGIHAFFGSFVAGMIVPRHGQLPQQIAPKIELVVREVLLPLFFANNGIRTDITTLKTGESWGYCIVIIAIATFAKMVPTFLVTKCVTRERFRYCTTVAILMNTRGLVELIALNIGLQFKILSPRMFTILVLMAIATTAMTAPILHFIWIRHEKQESGEDEGNLSENFLTDTLDKDFLQAMQAEPGYDPEDLVSDEGFVQKKPANEMAFALQEYDPNVLDNLVVQPRTSISVPRMSVSPGMEGDAPNEAQRPRFSVSYSSV